MSDKIFKFVEENEHINAVTAAEIIDRSQATARRILRQMVERNLLIPLGGNKNRIYKKNN